jgi:hypothetical protein
MVCVLRFEQLSGGPRVPAIRPGAGPVVAAGGLQMGRKIAISSSSVRRLLDRFSPFVEGAFVSGAIADHPRLVGR